MVWLVQSCRSIKCLQFLKPPELRRGGGFAPLGPLPGLCLRPAGGTVCGPQTPRLLTPPPPLTTNPGSAPDYCQFDTSNHQAIVDHCCQNYRDETLKFRSFEFNTNVGKFG